MSITKFFARHPLLGVALFMSLLVSVACVPARLGTSWAALSILGDGQNVMMAYNDRIVLVNPTNGRLIEMKDEDGDVVVDAEGKARQWVLTGAPNTHNQFYSTPVLFEDNLLLADYNGVIYTVDPLTAEIDKTATPVTGQHMLADLVLANDTLYMAMSDKNLVALDPAELTVKWTVPTGRGVWSKPLVTEDEVYFGSMDHFLYAVDAETGEELWKTDLGGALTGTPVLHNDRLYIGNLARKLFAVSLEGEILNEYVTEDWIWGTVKIEGDTLYTADMTGWVYALNISDGITEQWKLKVANRGIRPSPLLTEDSVVVASRDGFVYWLDRATGAARFSSEIGAEMLSEMLVIEGQSEPLIVVSTVAGDKLLVALTLEGGQQRWKYPN